MHFGEAWDVNNLPIPNVWRGIDVDIAVYGQYGKSVAGPTRTYDLTNPYSLCCVARARKFL